MSPPAQMQGTPVSTAAHPLAHSPSHSRPSSPVKRSSSEPFESWLDSFIVASTSLDDYRTIKTLGQGTFGKVKLAEHLESGRKVAIKYIEKANIKTPKQKASVKREVRLLKLLRHPNIVNVFDVIETHDYISIIMEYIPNLELFEHIVKNHHLSEAEARKYMQQIVSALEYCHHHCVIHRDLKPENLLLDAEMNVKLIDFGFVNTFDGQSALDTFCGSPFYASPQMIRGIRYYGPESDVWSLGVVLFAMLSGRLPFDAEDMKALYDRIASGVFKCPSHFSPEVVDLIRHMLVVSPKDRYNISDVRSHPWMQWQAAPPVLRRGTHVDSLSRPLAPFQPRLLEAIQSFGFSIQDITTALNQPHIRHPIVGYYRLLFTADEVMTGVRLSTDSHYGSAATVHASSNQQLASPAPTSSTSSMSPVEMESPREHIPCYEPTRCSTPTPRANSPSPGTPARSATPHSAWNGPSTPVKSPRSSQCSHDTPTREHPLRYATPGSGTPAKPTSSLAVRVQGIFSGTHGGSRPSSPACHASHDTPVASPSRSGASSPTPPSSTSSSTTLVQSQRQQHHPAVQSPVYSHPTAASVPVAYPASPTGASHVPPYAHQNANPHSLVPSRSGFSTFIDLELSVIITNHSGPALQHAVEMALRMTSASFEWRSMHLVKCELGSYRFDLQLYVMPHEYIPAHLIQDPGMGYYGGMTWLSAQISINAEGSNMEEFVLLQIKRVLDEMNHQVCRS